MYERIETRGFRFLDFWEQHNDHRIFASRVAFAIDYTLFSGRQYFLYVLNYALSFLIFFLLLEGFRSVSFTDQSETSRKLETSKLDNSVIIALAALLAWHPIQALNLNWAFQSQFFFVPLFLILCLKTVLSERSGLSFWLILTIWLFLGMTSMSNGLTLPAIVTLAIWYSGRGPRAVVYFVTISIALYLFYFSGYEFREESLGDEPVGIFEIIAFTVNFLTVLVRTPEFGIIPRFLLLGLSILPLALAALLITIRKPLPKPVVIATLVALFCGLSAGMTAYGRASLGIELGLTYRYATIALIYWVCALSVAIYFIGTWKPSLVMRSSSSLVFFGAWLLFGSIIFVADRTDARPASQVIADRKVDGLIVTDAQRRGLLTADIAQRVFPGENFVFRYIPFMEEQNIATFKSDLPAIELREPVSTESLPNCPVITIASEIVKSASAGPTAKFNLRFPVSRHGFTPTHVQVQTSSGDILNSNGLFTIFNPDTQMKFVALYAALGVEEGETVERFRAIFEDDEGENRCVTDEFDVSSLILPRLKTDGATVVSSTTVLTLANDAIVKTNGSASLNAVFRTVAADLESVCSAGSLWGTRATSDGDIGQINIDLTGMSTENLLSSDLTLVTGPSTSNLTLQVTYEDGHSDLIGIPILEALHRIPVEALLKNKSKPVQLTLSDEGRGWGTWLGTCGLAMDLN